MQTYTKLATVARKYYNDEGYCGVISVATICGTAYGKAFRECERLGRAPRTGTNTRIIEQAIKNLSNGSLNVIIDQTMTYTYKGATIGRFEQIQPQGMYLILMSGGRHIAAYRNGIVNDWCSAAVSGKPRRHKINQIWRIEVTDQ
jgi:hypothetical protein